MALTSGAMGGGELERASRGLTNQNQNQQVVTFSLLTPALGDPVRISPSVSFPVIQAFLPSAGLRRAGLGMLVLVCQPLLPLLQEVFQDSPIPFCLIRTCSAGNVAGSHVLPCGSKQSALPRENSVFVKPNQRGAVMSPPQCFCLSCPLIPPLHGLSAWPVDRPHPPPRQALS